MRRVAFAAAAVLALAAFPAWAEVQVTDAALSTDVVDRHPQGVGNEFPASAGRIYCFTKVTGMAKGEVLHRWIRDGKVETVIPLRISGPSWRVWSAKSLYPESVGNWKVEVVDAAGGTVLKTLEFTVRP